MNAMILSAAVVLAAPGDRRHDPVTTLEDAAVVLDDFRDLYLKRVPPALMADAKAVVVIPNTVKAGFLIGGRRGHGVVFARGADGAWGEPAFVTLTGLSAGFQAGVGSTDVVLVFRAGKGLDRLLEGKAKVTLGGDAAVAAGPLGREAAAGTDARLTAEVYSYSRSRGLFAGVSLQGAAITADHAANGQFARDTRPGATKAADAVKKRLLELAPPESVPDTPAIPPAKDKGRPR